MEDCKQINGFIVKTAPQLVEVNVEDDEGYFFKAVVQYGEKICFDNEIRVIDIDNEERVRGCIAGLQQILITMRGDKL